MIVYLEHTKKTILIKYDKKISPLESDWGIPGIKDDLFVSVFEATPKRAEELLRNMLKL